MNIDSVLQTLIGLATTWGVRIVGVLVALLVANSISKYALRAVVRALERREFDQTLTRFFGALIRWAILGGAIIGCLGVFGIQTASFAAVIAAIGLAIGLALQGTLSNFAAGVMLLIFRPFKIGDVVKVGGTLGIVVELQLFTTDLKTPDNRKLVMPNSQIFGAVIENINAYDTRRVDISVGVDYAEDVEKVRGVLEGAVAKIDGVLADPPHQVFLASLGASSVDWAVRVWTETPKYWDVYQAGIREVKKALDEAGISIPFPQTDVHLDKEVVKALQSRAA